MDLVRLTKLKSINGELQNLNSYEREFFYVIMRLKKKKINPCIDIYYNEFNMPVLLYNNVQKNLFYSTRIECIFSDVQSVKKYGNTNGVVNNTLYLHLGITSIKAKFITERTWDIVK